MRTFTPRDCPWCEAELSVGMLVLNYGSPDETVVFECRMCKQAWSPVLEEDGVKRQR
jgi:hypothetical protein